MSAESPADRDARVAILDGWKRRRDDKKLQIADECLDAIRLRGLDPSELGITRVRIHAALFARTESDLDGIIDRTVGRP